MPRSFLWNMLDAVAGAAVNPTRIVRGCLRRLPGVPFELRLKYDAVSRPAYAYGVHSAALEAKELGIDRITAIEFGVGPGGGLVALDEVAGEVLRATGVSVQVIGFDTGRGLPPPRDYRDIPYRWAEGEFRMDERGLRSRLKSAELILGNVRDTIGAFLNRRDLAPIGFISFDLDYHSSTIDAMVLLDAADRFFLPRVFCHMDDVIGGEREFMCEYVGELLAIREYNDSHEHRKLAPINGLAHKRPIPAWWNDTMYVFHMFQHPLYSHLLPKWNFQDPEADRKLAELRQSQAQVRTAWLGERQTSSR